MKPWFIKEDNVIPFPKKDTGVVRLPNVNAYPDFLSGVQDLQNHLKRGDISSDIHKKLYQDLIHRFMKTESFETPWFLREYDPKDASGIMGVIKQRLNDPTIDNETLNKVLMALEGGGLTKRLQNVLTNDPDAKRILEKVTETIFQAKGTPAELDFFIKQYPKGLVNIQNITAAGKKNWSEIFIGYQPGNFVARVVQRLYGLKNQGIGPGEICLSVLSPQIFHTATKPGAGDIFIEGAGRYEIKGELSKAGRLYDTRKSNVDMNTIQQIRDQLKLVKPRINLNDLIAAKPTQNQIAALITSIFRYVDKNQVSNFVKNIMSGNEAQAKIEHTKLAYQNYRAMTTKDNESFVGIIFMSQNGEWTNVISTVEQLVQNLAVGTIYVMSPDQADFFPQTTFKFKQQ